MVTKKGGMPVKRPTQVEVKPNGDEVIVRPGPVAAPKAEVPSAAELRAEREPAVVIRRSKPSLWQRARAWFGARREARQEMADNMAAVKAGVLHELETMGVKKGVAVSGRPFGSPFASILLPTPKKRRWWGGWVVLAAAAVVFLGIIFWFGHGKEQPNDVLVDALVAVRDHDVRALEAKVDVASVATSVVNQMFNIPQQSGNPLAAKMTAFVKPGLAEGLRDEILATVDGTNKLEADSGTLLGKIWQELGGNELRVGAPAVAMQNDTLAVAELPLVRRDLGLTLPLQVVLNKDANKDGGWQVVDVPNLAVVLENVMQAERVLDERRREGMVNVAADGVRVLSVKKMKDVKLASNLIVSMEIANGGMTDATDVQLDVAFGDAAGQPMMTTRLTLDGVLPAGGHREQVWNVPINRAHGAERYVADLPLSALSVTATVAK